MSDPGSIVIVGAGLAGAKAAETLRAQGFDGRVVLIGDEPERPYERPPLSKDYLRGEVDREGPAVHAAGFYEEQRIELRTGTPVESIDPAGRRVTLAGGEELAWDRLLLATGAAPRRLSIPGADLDGVLLLRELADSDRLREAISAGPLAVIGAGWLGCEVAASARQLGAEVVLIERESAPLLSALGAEMGKMFADLHAFHGVDLVTRATVEAFEGDGRVERVRLADGRLIDCAAVLVGVGVSPRTELAEAAGLAVENGVLADATLLTSAPDVYAAGDVANAEHPFYGRRVRVEHWANAINQGETAARNMLGAGEPYERIPYFFTDQYDLGMEYAGLADPAGDELVVRGDLATRELVAFWTADGRVTAGMNVNVWDVSDPIQELIRSRAKVGPARLRDPDVPIEALGAP